ncbi:MAG: hypothetical protein N2515_02355 [Deltaproteobacteria bacterium]|nr:hypothetical protein [Deltaproteobacteria bacterium]
MVFTGLAKEPLWGCGPSLRRTEQGSLFFERCHAAERDPSKSNAEKQGCWKRWLEFYSEYQPSDRITYARERLIALEPKTGTVLELAGISDLNPSALHSVLASPLPSALFVPLESEKTAGQRQRLAPPFPPFGACGKLCESNWGDCVGRCPSRSFPCIDACAISYRICSRACE